jgi:hypothetical protein
VSGRRLFERIVAAIADGQPVDWAAAEREVASPDEAEILRELRALSRVGETHRITAAASEALTIDPRAAERDVAHAPGVTLRAGDRWGRYKLVRRVGKGSFGAGDASERHLRRGRAARLHGDGHVSGHGRAGRCQAGAP